ncbi:MAG: DsrE family protein [Proteobacteria bacterium]|jgi:intracellular sulfur oxidation DsrE/DsrF family protein|nr:DsrE family protein [Pseudomonadota bacterium]MBK8959251.1 DsrE family protein [Pseudomonadota bacterium]
MRRRSLLGAALAAVAVTPALRAADDATPIRVVYHVSEGLAQAKRALRLLKNHHQADPSAKLVVVALGDGIEFLLQDAVDDGNYPFELLVEPLAAEGVEFRICRNTLESRKVDLTRLLPQAQIVPAGIAEIARLQAREGFVYVKP